MIQLYPQWMRMVTVWQDDGYGNLIHVPAQSIDYYRTFQEQDH